MVTSNTPADERVGHFVFSVASIIRNQYVEGGTWTLVCPFNVKHGVAGDIFISTRRSTMKITWFGVSLNNLFKVYMKHCLLTIYRSLLFLIFDNKMGHFSQATDVRCYKGIHCPKCQFYLVYYPVLRCCHQRIPYTIYQFNLFDFFRVVFEIVRRVQGLVSNHSTYSTSLPFYVCALMF